MEIQLADGIADIKLLDTWQANCSTIFIISLILDTCSASACFIVGPTCAKYIWHLPEDRPKILSFERGDLLGLRQLEFQKGQADTKTSRQKSRISWLTTTVPISYTVLYLHCILTRAARQVMLTQTRALLYIHFTAALGPSCHEATIGYRWRFMT